MLSLLTSQSSRHRFPALYAYTDSVSDIGNVDAMSGEAAVHLSFFYRGLARVLKPGRVAIVHVAQLPRMKRSGGVGLADFRGTNIRIGERAGLTFEYDWSVRKNPQSQAIRTRSRELQFSGLESDRARSRGTLQDYLLKFTKSGENAVAATIGLSGLRVAGMTLLRQTLSIRKQPRVVMTLGIFALFNWKLFVAACCCTRTQARLCSVHSLGSVQRVTWLSVVRVPRRRSA